MKFKALSIDNWKQFDTINLQFHPSLTVLTGANGSGKTTILNLLARHFGWSLTELATPTKGKEKGIFEYIIRLFKSTNDPNNMKIGELLYDIGKADLVIPKNATPQYQIKIQGQVQVRGLNIPSHRPVYSYQQVPHISTQRRTRQDAYNLVFQSYYSPFNNSHSQSTSFFIKETLMNWAIGGSGNEFVVPDDELRRYYLGFEAILAKVLPPTLGFRKLSIRQYEVILETASGDFMLDAVSGGISAIIDLAWQIFNYTGEDRTDMVVLMDEVENHLHATMQRRILTDFVSAFPEVQFIVSTHSPLIVGSVKDSAVYVFRYNEANRVISEYLDMVNKAKTANQVLNDVLGVPVTMPIWAEEALKKITSGITRTAIDANSLKTLRSELAEIGLESFLPQAVEKIVEEAK